MFEVLSGFAEYLTFSAVFLLLVSISVSSDEVAGRNFVFVVFERDGGYNAFFLYTETLKKHPFTCKISGKVLKF